MLCACVCACVHACVPACVRACLHKHRNCFLHHFIKAAHYPCYAHAVNLMLIESLESYDKHFNDRLLVDFPTVGGRPVRLGEVAVQLCSRLVNIFLPDENGRRPCHGTTLVHMSRYHSDPPVTVVNYHLVMV